MARLASAIICTGLLTASGSVRAEPFTVECQLPFASIEKHRPIDDICAARGVAKTDDSAERVSKVLQRLTAVPTQCGAMRSQRSQK